MPHHRSTDDPSLTVKVTREVPLWGILGVIGTGILCAGSMYYGQQGLAMKVSEQNETIKALSTQMQLISTELASRKSENAMLTMKLETFDRRLQMIETTREVRR